MDQKKAGVLLTYLSMGLRVLIGLVFTPFMLMKVGDSQYGVYSLSLSLISFISLLDLGFGQTLVRYIARSRALDSEEEEAELNGFFLRLYSIIAGIAFIAGFALVFLYPLLCKQTMTEEELRLFRAVFLVLLADTVISFPMCVFSASINAHERFLFQKAADVAALLVKYALMTLLLLQGHKVLAITIATCAVSTALRVINALYCRQKLSIRFSRKAFPKEQAREIFLFSFFIFLNLIIDFLYNSTDKLILGAVRGTLAVTTYSFGVYFESYFQELSTAMSGVFMPKVVYLFEHDKDINALSNLFLRVGRLQMAILLLALSGYVTYGKEFICLWVGSEHASAYYIGLLIMLPAAVPLTQNIGISILRAMNLHKYRSYMYLAIAVLNVVISIPLAKRYSGVGAAVGTCIACVAGQIIYMNLYYSRKIGLDIRQYWKNLAVFLAGSVPLSAAAMLLKRVLPAASWAAMAIHITAYTLVYAAIYWFVLSDDSEKELIRDLVAKFRRARA